MEPNIQTSTKAKASLVGTSGRSKLVLKAPVTAWIELELVDHESQPVADEPYQLEVQGGKVIDGVLDGSGQAREEGLTPGLCTVAFPDRDPYGWRPRIADEAKTHWLQVTLLDHAEQACAGQPYRMKLIDGSKREGTLDDTGTLRHDDLPPGLCMVEFPEIDPRALVRDSMPKATTSGSGPQEALIEHVVEPGEDMLTIADRYGFASWETIYYHNANDALREECLDPFTLRHGATVRVPDKADRYETSVHHAFQLAPLLTTWVRLVMEDYDGTSLADKRYELTVEGETFAGRTTADGAIEHEVPVGVTEGTLQLWMDDAEEPEEWDVALGQLEPVTTAQGIQDRLINLGYLAAADIEEEAGELGEVTQAALREFQEGQGLNPTGRADAATRLALSEAQSDGPATLKLFCAVDESYTLRLKPPLMERVQLVMEDYDGTPLADKRYELTVEGETFAGRTTADGAIEHEVPVGVTEGTLQLWMDDAEEPEEWDVALGQLEPVTTAQGIQDRLINLGYLAAADIEEEVGELGEVTQAALREFQEGQELDPTGQDNAATLELLFKQGSL